MNRRLLFMTCGALAVAVSAPARADNHMLPPLVDPVTTPDQTAPTYYETSSGAARQNWIYRCRAIYGGYSDAGADPLDFCTAYLDAYIQRYSAALRRGQTMAPVSGTTDVVYVPVRVARPAPASRGDYEIVEEDVLSE